MIANFSVKKPYTVLVGVVLVIVLGIVSMSRMVTDLLPDMSFPYVLVITPDPGATPEEVENEVTAPIEAALASTTNIKSIRSTSSNNYSMVILEYEQNTNMDSRMIEIQQSLDLVSASFSDTIGTPNILQISPDMLPVMAVAVSMDGYDDLKLLRFVEDELQPAIESVEGAASVDTVSSAGEEIIKITTDESKIDALNDRLKNAIKGQFRDAKSELNSGKQEIEDARSQMSAGSSQLSGGINQILGTKDEMAKSQKDLEKKLKELNKQKKSLLALQDSLRAITENESFEMMADLPVDDTLAESLKALGVTVKTYKDIPDALAAVGATLVQVDTGIASIKEGLKQIEEGQVGLSDALGTLNANASIAAIEIGMGAAQLAEASAGLNSAEGQVEKAEEDAINGTDLNDILSLETIGDIIKAQDFNMPAGYVLDDETRYMIRVTNSVEDMESLKNLVLMDMGFDELGIIKLSDVANVEMVQEETNGYAIVNGKPGVLMSVQKQTGYSTGESTKNLKERFEILKNEYEGLSIDILMDQSIYINFIVKSVLQNIILGAILACIVLFAFLRNIRPTIIIAISIPVSVIFAIMVMYFTGITLNMISLSGLALAIGMLVDNSIVAMENIFRLRAKGYSVKEAAIKGVNEIAGAITASTLTTVSVYAPIIFTEGLTKQLFVDIALTILFTLMASLIVAVTVVPAMAGTLFAGEIKEQNQSFKALQNIYKKILTWCLSHRLISCLVAVVILFGSAFGSLSKGLNFMDMNIEANQLSASIEAPEGKVYDFDTLCDRADRVLSALDGMDDIETVGAMGGGGGGISMFSGGGDSISLYIVLKEDTKRTLSEISDEIKERTKDIDAKIDITTDSMDYSAYFASGISAEIRGQNLDTLQDLAKEVAGIMEENPGIEKVNDVERDTQPEFRITVDREKAAKYKYTVAQVFALVMQKLADTNSSTTVTMDPYKYEVYIETEEQSNVTLSDIEKLSFEFTNKDGDKEDIKLSDICKFEKTTTLTEINRKSQTRLLTVGARVKEDYNVTLVSNEITEKINSLDIPEGYAIEMTGEDETIRDSMEQMLLMLILAVIFIYLIMVAQFQSLKSPFIIMFTMPLAFTGGFLALLLTNNTLNVIAMLGFVMLSGLIVNNGIVLIDYINMQREEGLSKREAIINAGVVRLRPVLMTVLTTILSVSTIALGIGKGSAMMQPMAIVIVGGLIYGTLLTLVIVPCIYDLFHREKNIDMEI